ncbi:MAG: PEGA domain-containing protein [Acidobacteriota bacterium]
MRQAPGDTRPLIMDRQRPWTRRDDSSSDRRGRRTNAVDDRAYRSGDARSLPDARSQVRKDRRDRYRYDRHDRYYRGYYDDYYSYDRFRRYRGFRYCYTPSFGYYYDTPFYHRSAYRWYYNPYYGFAGAFSFWSPYWFVPNVTVNYGGGHSGYYGAGGYSASGYESSYGTGVGVGALDLDVSPEEALIFIDGKLVGTADDYDGFPDFLWLEEGTYDVAIYHPGYETIFRQYSIYPGLTIDVEDSMRPGESIHPDDHGPKTTERRDARIELDRQRRAEADAAEARRSQPQQGVEIGRLVLDIWPADAAVYLNGNFLGQAAEVSQLSAGILVEPGEHDLQVVHPDFPKRDLKIALGPGERQELAIVLEK